MNATAPWWSADQIEANESYLRPPARARFPRAVVVAIIMVVFVGAEGPRRILDGLSIHSWAVGVLVLMLAMEALVLPVAIAHDAWLDLIHNRRFGRSTMGPQDELIQQSKAFVFRVVVHTVVLLPLFWLIRSVDLWWIPAWLLLAMLGSSLAAVAPHLARLKPTTMPPQPVADAVQASSARLGFPVTHVEVFDDTRNPRTEAGYLIRRKGSWGLVLHGSRLDLAESALVHAAGDLTTTRALGCHRTKLRLEIALGLVLFGSLALVTGSDDVQGAVGADGPGDPVMLPVLAMTALVARMASSVLKSAATRRMVRRADAHQLRSLGDPVGFVTARRFTAELVLDDLNPHGLRALHRPNPSATERMAAAFSRSVMPSGGTFPLGGPPSRGSHDAAPEGAR